MLPLLDMICDEDDGAYVTAVYEENKYKLYKIAYGILNNHHDAEDCVQDVIIALIRYLDRYRAATPVHRKNILFRMCRNIAIDKYRKQKRREAHEEYAGDDREWTVVDEDAFVDVLLDKAEQSKRLLAMMDSIGESYSDVLYYFYYMQMSVSEIAQLLSLTEANVKMRLTRARRKMLAVWEEELHELRK